MIVFSQRQRRWGLVLGALILFYTVFGFFIAPALMRSLAEKKLNEIAAEPVHIGKIKLNPYRLELVIEDFSIGDESQQEVGFSRLLVDLELDSIWHKTLHFQRVELNDPKVRVELDAEGDLNLVNLFASAATADTSEPAIEPEASASVKAADSKEHEVEDPQAENPQIEEKAGLFPVQVDQLKLTDGVIHFIDKTRAPEFATELDNIDLELADFSTQPDRSGRYQLLLGLEGATLKWRGQFGVAPLQGSGDIEVKGVPLNRVGSYLQSQLDGVIEKGSLSVASHYRFAVADTVQLELEKTGLQLDNFVLKAQEGDRTLVSIPKFAIADASLDLAKQEIDLGQVKSQGTQLAVDFDQKGQVNLASIWRGSEASPSAAEPEPEVEAAPWQWQLPLLELTDWEVKVKDIGTPGAKTQHLSGLSLKVTGLASDTKEITLDLASQVGKQGQLDLNGTIKPESVALDLQLSSREIDISGVSPYLIPYLNLRVKRGLVSGDLAVHWSAADGAQVSGDLGLNRLQALSLPKRKKLFELEQLQVQGLSYQQQPAALKIDQITLNQPVSWLVIGADKTLNLSQLVKPQPSSGKSAKASQQQPMSVQISKVGVHNGAAYFVDRSMSPAFATRLGELNGDVTGISSRPGQRTQIQLAGKVDRYAPLTIKGELDPFDVTHNTDLKFSIENLALTPLTPYSGHFAGYAIKKGRMDLMLGYLLSKDKLQGTNTVKLDKLTLGDPVASPAAVNLPLPLAIALLKDRQGLIDMDLPVSGDLNDPQFSLGGVIGTALSNFVMNVVSSPFSALGSVFADDDSFSDVAFAPGQVSLPKGVSARMQQLAEAMKERPQLVLEVTGVANQADWVMIARETLHRQALERFNEEAWFERKAFSNLSEQDYLEVLQGIWQEEQGDLPESLAASAQALEAELIRRRPVDELILRQLGKARAMAIKDYLANETGLKAIRVYLLGAQLESGDNQEVVTRLSLGAR